MPAHDALVRIALVLMMQDLTYPLTPAQRAWLEKRLKTRDPLTPAERQRLKEPLLAWARARQAGCLAVLEKQF